MFGIGGRTSTIGLSTGISGLILDLVVHLDTGVGKDLGDDIPATGAGDHALGPRTELGSLGRGHSRFSTTMARRSFTGTIMSM